MTVAVAGMVEWIGNMIVQHSQQFLLVQYHQASSLCDWNHALQFAPVAAILNKLIIKILTFFTYILIEANDL